MGDDTKLMYLGFGLSEQFCGFAMESVQEVLQMVELTLMPDAPDYVAGAINLRGSVLPVIDMAKLIGTTPRPYTLDTPILVVRVEGKTLGLIVDSVHDVMEFPADDVDTPTDVFPMRRLLSGVARTDQGLLMIFDLARVLALASGLPVPAEETDVD